MPGLGEQLAFSSAAGAPAKVEFQLELQVRCAPRVAAAPLHLEGAAGPSHAEAGGLAWLTCRLCRSAILQLYNMCSDSARRGHPQVVR